VTRIKICGITSVADALAVERAGADALGLVFYPPSPRYVELDAAAAIARAVGPFITTVALFVNPDPALVRDVLVRVQPHLLQFHGDETPAFCAQFGHPYIRAVRVRTRADIEAGTRDFASAQGFIFDAWDDTLYGGTGRTFNWELIRDFAGPPVILAGGLRADNLGPALAATRPYGVDVSGGVESAPGVKDHGKIRDFVAAVRAAAG